MYPQASQDHRFRTCRSSRCSTQIGAISAAPHCAQRLKGGLWNCFMERFPPETSAIPLGDYASATGVPVKKLVKLKLLRASRARARRSRLAAQLAWPAELRGRGRRPPDRDSMMVAFGRVLALDFGLARWCSLSLGAWLPSAAPDHGRAGRGRFSFLRIWVAAQPSSCCRDPPRRMMQYGAANSILMLSGGGLAGAAASVNA